MPLLQSTRKREALDQTRENERFTHKTGVSRKNWRLKIYVMDTYIRRKMQFYSETYNQNDDEEGH